ncbi:hypothetical protein SAMN06296010_1207 [Agreia pratensis]|uniref:Uncharacterized protein n=1 Tax=Agreia pratensis TaxID=150121 RepID=A0A1X7JAN0_9MICO|nr:hypothetical protein SAMN06296010_1207 [Agreia pratensis]
MLSRYTVSGLDCRGLLCSVGASHAKPALSALISVVSIQTPKTSTLLGSAERLGDPSNFSLAAGQEGIDRSDTQGVIYFE